MEIRKIENKNLWENFLLECEEKTFLQSWNWGEFQKKMGNKIWRLGIYDKMSNVKSQMSNPIAIALVIKIEAKRGRFLFVPHGPVVKNPKSQILNPKSQILNKFLEELRKIAKQEQCSFIRIAPIWERVKESEEIFKDLGFRPAPMHTHPEVTWELNLEEPEESLLMNMRKTTRYLIKQGLKNETLQVEKSQDPNDIKIFNELYQKTALKHHFVPFSLSYLKNEFLSFLPDNQISLFFAKYKEKILASAIIIFWQKIAFYHHGASSLKYPKIPASYLLQWEAIKEAKRKGCKLYNFWGIADIKSKIKNKKSKIKKHPFWGFKKGFSGYEKKYLRTQDLPLSFKYWFTFCFEKLRKKKRGF